MNMDIRKIKEWYDKIEVRFELIRYLYNREFSVLIPAWFERYVRDSRKLSVRNIRCHNTTQLNWILNKGVRMFEKVYPYNLYYSLAKFGKGVPYSTFNFAERNMSEWNKTAQDHIVSYDFLLDIDAGEHSDIGLACLTAKNIIMEFNKLNVPFEIVFSGKGFHIKIPFEYFPYSSLNPNYDDNMYNVFSSIARGISEEFSEMIDTKIYDTRRLCKIPFSLALYDNSIYVCYPFKTLEDFYKFTLEDYSLNNFKKSLLNHGRMVFNREGNVSKLLEKYL